MANEYRVTQAALEVLTNGTPAANGARVTLFALQVLRTTETTPPAPTDTRRRQITF